MLKKIWILMNSTNPFGAISPIIFDSRKKAEKFKESKDSLFNKGWVVLKYNSNSSLQRKLHLAENRIYELEKDLMKFIEHANDMAVLAKKRCRMNG